jgi:hypothetical protein
MVNMGMGENQGINGGAIAGTLPIEFESLLAFTLKKAAVKHDLMAVHLDEML